MNEWFDDLTHKVLNNNQINKIIKRERIPNKKKKDHP